MKSSCCAVFSQDIAPLVLRLPIGFVFLMAGWGKFEDPDKFVGMVEKLGLPFPVIQAWAAIGAEVVGGAFLMAGLLTRLMTVPLLITMGVAISQVHVPKLSSPETAQFGQMMIMYCGVLMAGLASLLFTGAGRVSADGIIFSGCCRKAESCTIPESSVAPKK